MLRLSDGVYDWADNWQQGWYPLADVDPMTNIGRAYVNETGKTEIGLFELSTVIASPPLYLEKVAGGARTIVDGRKMKADARVIIETKENGSGFVRIQRAPDTPTDDAFIASEIKKEELLQMYYWDLEQGMWCLCPESGVNVNRNCVSAKVYHLSKFALK